jgi:cytochrome c
MKLFVITIARVFTFNFKSFFFIIPAVGVFYGFIVSFVPHSNDAPNDPPIVRITEPISNSKFRWNSMLRYTISVSDKEDGNSEYDEIAANEVLLEVAYLADSSNVKKYLSQKAKQLSDPPGLSLMKTTNCFSCHSSKNKLIGPSFQLIAKRYTYNAATAEALAQKIIKGSTGIWGNVKMPPHPQFKTDQAKQITRWILQNNKDPDVYYLAGTTGAIRTKEKPQKGAGTGVYLLTASYTDHGAKGMPQPGKRGYHTVVLRPY